MQKRVISMVSDEKLFLKYKTAMDMFDVSRNTLNKIAADADAIVYIGRMKRYDKEKLIQYFRSHSGNKMANQSGL